MFGRKNMFQCQFLEAEKTFSFCLPKKHKLSFNKPVNLSVNSSANYFLMTVQLNNEWENNYLNNLKRYILA
jgi:hypothetical protein